MHACRRVEGGWGVTECLPACRLLSRDPGGVEGRADPPPSWFSIMATIGRQQHQYILNTISRLATSMAHHFVLHITKCLVAASEPSLSSRRHYPLLAIRRRSSSWCRRRTSVGRRCRCRVYVLAGLGHHPWEVLLNKGFTVSHPISISP